MFTARSTAVVMRCPRVIIDDGDGKTGAPLTSSSIRGVFDLCFTEPKGDLHRCRSETDGGLVHGTGLRRIPRESSWRSTSSVTSRTLRSSTVGAAPKRPTSALPTWGRPVKSFSRVWLNEGVLRVVCPRDPRTGGEHDGAGAASPVVAAPFPGGQDDTDDEQEEPYRADYGAGPRACVVPPMHRSAVEYCFLAEPDPENSDAKQ